MALRKQLLDSFSEKKSGADLWIHLAVFGLLVFAFWPVTQWFAASAHEQSRLSHALIVISLAIAALVRFGSIEITDTLNLNPGARLALIYSFALLLGQFIGQSAAPESWRGLFSLLTIPAYCCALAAVARFFFGEGTRRLTLTAAGTLCTFLLFSIVMQPLDWPLRSFAGEWSAAVLSFAGKAVELGLVGSEGGPPRLIMWVNQHPYHVASECNGFGVIMTSLLISMLLALHRKLGIFDTGLNLLAGLIIGFVFNILRIVVIVLLAPSMMDHYMLMHEIVGGITYWGCILLVWILLNGPTKDEPAEAMT